MAQAVPDFYLEALTEGHGVRSRITLVDWDRNELLELSGESGDVVGGNVALTRLQAPYATFNGRVANARGKWTPRTARDVFAINSLIKIERGIVTLRGSVLFQTMLGLVKAPTIQVTASDNVLTFNLTDLWAMFAKKRASKVHVFEKGSPIGDGIRFAAVQAGWPNVDAWFAFDDGRQAFAATQVVQVDDLWPDFMQQTARDYALELRPRYDGTLLLQPAPSASNPGAPVRLYEPGETSTLIEVTKGLYDDGLYNRTKVKGQSSRTGTVVIAEARDMSPVSPTYNPPPGFDPAYPNGGGPMGDLTMEPYQSAGIIDLQQAQAKADQLLLEACLFQETHAWRFIQDASVVVGDVVTLREPESDVVGDVLLDEISFDVSEGQGDDTSSVTSKRLRALAPA